MLYANYKIYHIITPSPRIDFKVSEDGSAKLIDIIFLRNLREHIIMLYVVIDVINII